MFRILIPWLVSMALLGGCSGAACPVEQHTDPARMLRLHRSLTRTVASFRAEARVDQLGREGRVRGTVLMFLQRPNRVRFDAMTQFGPAAILTSDGQEFQLTDLRENRYLHGPTCPANIGRLLGIPMAGEDVVRFLLGDAPLIDAERETIGCGDDGYLVTRWAADGRRQELVLAVRSADRQAPPAQQHTRLKRAEVFDADGKTEWRVTFDDHRVVDDPQEEEGVALPFVIHFVDPRHDADTIVRFEKIDLDVEVPDGAFRQAPRPGISAEHVACE